MVHLNTILSKDRGRLLHLQAHCRRNPGDSGSAQTLASLLAQSQARFQQRLEQVPKPIIDDTLPVGAYALQLQALLQEHQVLVVAGETGSGKTTQLPKICLAAGRGISGLIGCTQPRRIAARAVAKRVADELQVPIGGAVGYQVRFNEQVGEQTYVKFMTDGILLAEIQSDSWLSKYDTLIIDEAHERSLNIDFLLGYIKNLLQKRRDLKVIITSATIDTERFSKHFFDAPVLAIEGRSFPVELRYRDFQTPESMSKATQLERIDALSLSEKIVLIVDEISQQDGLGDILVFLPGEREIRETHVALARKKYRATDIVALYARLSVKEQDRVFQPGAGRRIVLATNVAETSLTVPRIRYVIDPGIARIKRYSPRQKLDRLHSEAISQASANQRKGRCGRVAAGICYRLYSEQDFNQRAVFTDPEIKRAALAGVILRMLSLRLGAVEKFPFVEAPDVRAINDGWQTLSELGAIDGQRQLTETGKQMSRLPVDVKLSRMLVAAQQHGVLQELLVISAFMGIQDPRERPSDAKQAADNAHRQFVDAQSEFLSVLQLWRHFKQQHEALSQSQLRKWCEKNFLSYLRMREWRELHRQLLITCQELQWDVPAWSVLEARWQNNAQEPKAAQAHYRQVHRALLAGLPTQVGHKNEKGIFDAPRQRKFHIFPGSTLAKHVPAWCLVGTLLDTQKVWGMMAAKIEPEWLVEECPHLLSKKYFDPHWSRSQGRVLGYCQISILGLLLAAKKPVHYGGIFPAEAHEIFIRQALLGGEINTRAAFVASNVQTLALAQQEEAKQRRVGLVADDDWQARWYLDRIPVDINTAESLDKWYRGLAAEKARNLLWSPDDLLLHTHTQTAQFPKYYLLGANQLALHYRFSPGELDDGVSLDVPIHLLNALDAAHLSWLVPGLVEEKVTALIRHLPKTLRRNYVPAPDFARAFVQAYPESDGDSLAGCLARFLSKTTGAPVSALDFSEAELEAHLHMNIRLADTDKKILIQSRDLTALKSDYSAYAERAFAAQAGQVLNSQLAEDFPDHDVPLSVTTASGVLAYPALVVVEDSVQWQAFARVDEANIQQDLALRFLTQKRLRELLKSSAKQLPITPKLGLIYSSIESTDYLRRDIVNAAFKALIQHDLSQIRSKAQFDVLHKDLARQLFPRSMVVLQWVEASLQQVAIIRGKYDGVLMGWASSNLADIKQHLHSLVYPGFLRETPALMLPHVPRYLKALSLRQDRALHDPVKDQQRILEIKVFVDALNKQRAETGALSLAWQQFWLDLEELRVQLFAQELGVKNRVSPKLLAKQLHALT